MLGWMLQGVGILADGEGEVDHVLTRESPCLVMLQEIGGVSRYLRAARKEASRQTFLYVCASMSLGRDRIKFHQERLSRM